MEERIGFAGDWHGNVACATSRLQEFGAAGVSTVYQVGDFGLWPGSGGKSFLRTVDATCEQSDVQLFIVLGNHEDYGRVKLMRTDDAGWLCLKDYPRLRFATRGHTWVDAAGPRFAALGGAGSIDRSTRRPGVSWWPDEQLTEDDCARLVTNVHSQGWQRVDVMITHEAPAGLRRLGITAAPAWLTPEVEAYCYAQRVRLREAMDEVAPRSLVHGHWHESFWDEWEGLTSTGFRPAQRPQASAVKCSVPESAAKGLPADLLGHWRSVGVRHALIHLDHPQASSMYQTVRKCFRSFRIGD